MNGCIARSLSLVVIPLAVGCLKVPSGDVEAAQAAMAAAVAAEAPEYAPEAWIAAQNAQSELEIELLAQQQASLLTRSYRYTKTQATVVRVAAEKALAEAQQRKTLAREEAARVIESAKAMYQEVSSLVDGAASRQGPAHVGTAADGQSSGHDALLQEADHALLEGRYTLAREKAEEALQSLNRVKEQVRGGRSESVPGGASTVHRAPGAVATTSASHRPGDSPARSEDPT